MSACSSMDRPSRPTTAYHIVCHTVYCCRDLTRCHHRKIDSYCSSRGQTSRASGSICYPIGPFMDPACALMAGARSRPSSDNIFRRARMMCEASTCIAFVVDGDTEVTTAFSGQCSVCGYIVYCYGPTRQRILKKHVDKMIHLDKAAQVSTQLFSGKSLPASYLHRYAVRLDALIYVNSKMHFLSVFPIPSFHNPERCTFWELFLPFLQ